ncbi:MAG: HD domain-containing protein [Candidatus Yanofskybacteria bacterium]|nr:HD domain-containing protein [Candidatus Yanofskybacteria bacterium]
MEATIALPDLEKEFEETMDELRFSEDLKMSVRNFLGILRQKSEFTYAHSLRVGFLARKIARFMHLPENALFLAGIFHDLGKSQIPLSTLHKTAGWTSEDAKIMESHVMDSYRILRDKFDFSAAVVLLHHQFQPNAYPLELPVSSQKYSKAEQVLIEECGRVLAIADVYDAMHRKNNKLEEGEFLTEEQIREKMLEFNEDRVELIEQLYNVGILERGIIPTDNPDEQLYEKAWQYLPLNISNSRVPRETARLVTLAAALEPLADKAGCTTRFTDVSRHLKLEYFVTGAINLGNAFEDLVSRLNGSPCIQGIYSHALQAQRESLKNRSGGRINQGIIELLVPIVAGQHLFYSGEPKDLSIILARAKNIALKSTGRGDVDSLIAMKRFAHGLCRYNERPVPEHPEAKNVFEYYSMDLASSTSVTGIAHNGEFVNGFPTVKLMYDTIMNSSKRLFMRKVEEAFQHGLKMHDKGVGRGFLADCVAAAIYLCLSQNPKIQLVV